MELMMLNKCALKIYKQIAISADEYKHVHDISFNYFRTNKRLNARVAISALRFTLYLLFLAARVSRKALLNPSLRGPLSHGRKVG